MKPILFPPTATEFKTQGLGALSDAISCYVTEERNGEYELEMQYPIDGIHFAAIADRCILLAIPSPYRLPQPFRVYRTTKPLNGVCTIYARHISYDLSGIPLNPFTASNAPEAMSGLSANAAILSGFAFWTDKSTAANFAVAVPSSTRSVLGGQAGSILDAYGGEYEWDNFTVKLHNQRGNDNGVIIRYGKNLTDLEQERNISGVLTGIYPYWADADGNLVTCDPKIINAPGKYDFVSVAPVDFSHDFDEKPTPEQLKARAESYVTANKIGIPKVSIKAGFVQLEQTEEYKDLALLEKCDLCDIVTVQFEKLGVNAKAEIVKIVTDVLLERYDFVEIGDARTSIADTISDQQREIQKRPTSSAVENIASQITAAILGAKGGAVRLLDTNNDGVPDTLYIADNPDPAQAHKVWRFNYEGWGASKTGYNGPFTIAAGIENGLYADFITAGTLNCALLNVINLVAQGVQLTGNFRTLNGNYMMEMWAAVLALFDGNNMRTRIYTTGTENSIGNVQVFSGNVTKSGGMQPGSRLTQVQPSYIECGADRDGNCDGIIRAGTVNADGGIHADAEITASKNIITSQAVCFNAVRPRDGQNTLMTNWKRGNELTANDFVLVGGAVAPYSEDGT